MVLVSGSPRRRSVLRPGVLCWPLLFLTNGLSLAVESSVQVPFLVCANLPTELNSMPCALSSHMLQRGGFQVKVFSDCLGVVNRFNLLTRGQVKLKVNSANADLWQWALTSVETLGLSKIQLHKVPAHRKVASATSRYEAWLFWHNAVADRVARYANLDRGETFWNCWQRHVEAVVAAQELHSQAWSCIHRHGSCTCMWRV